MTAGKFVFGLILTAWVLSAQTPGPAAPAAPSEANPMRLDVLALDSGGKPVNDLNASDFQVSDQGKEAKIIYFRRNEPAQAAAPNEFSNRTGAFLPRVTVILLDLLDHDRADGLDAARQVTRSLQQLESGESVYFYLLALDGSLHPIHGLPQQPAAVTAEDRTWNKQVGSQVDAAIKELPRTRPTGMGQEGKVKKAYVALETLSKQLAAYPCRRNIVWVTNEMPYVMKEEKHCTGDWIECALYIPHLSVNIERAGVVIHPVSYAASLDPGYARVIEQMADMVGGRWYQREDMGSILAQLASDAGSGYVIAYDAPQDNWDSKFHRIRVTCERKGLRIVTKQRYYAVQDTRPAAARADEVMMSALQAPSDSPDIGIKMTVSPVAGNPKSIHLQVRINTADLLLREQGDRLVDQVSVAFADYGANGLTSSPVPKNFTIGMTHEQLAKLTKDGIALAQDHPIDDTVRKVRFLVYDHGMNSVGSISVPVNAAAAPAQ